jgi:6-phosphogluconolactonase
LSKSTARTVKCLDDPQALCLAAADEFVRSYVEAVEQRSVFRVALSGGSTPCRLHRILTESPYREKISWDQVEFYFGDERAVHPEHADSNYRMARDTLLTELGIEDEKVHRMCAEQVDLDRAARFYEEQIAADFGTPLGGPPPSFDLILLGMGPDGHTASLFPDTCALNEGVRWVVGNKVPKLGCSRMTFTFPLINAAKRVLFMIPGEGKAEALAAVLEGPDDLSQYPSQGVRPSPGSVTYLIDQAAGAQLAPETSHRHQKES